MSGWELELKDEPELRLDLSALAPERIGRLSDVEIERLHVRAGGHEVAVGELFKIKVTAAEDLRLIGLTDRCDRVGQGMASGVLAVVGDVGAYAGAAMRDGVLRIKGSAGPLLAAGMKGGQIEISGDAGERVGAPLFDAQFGMQGGVVHIKGNAGAYVGERLRRGIIAVGGDAGDYAGARMVAGTIVLGGLVGRWPGYALRRGSLVMCEEPKTLLPTYVDCGVVEFGWLTLMQRQLRGRGIRILVPSRARRLIGDMAAMGKGEILIGA